MIAPEPLPTSPRHPRPRLVLLAVVALAPLPPTVAAQTAGTLAGRVLEHGTARPVAGATVTLQQTGARAASDGEGAFTFSEVPAGPLIVRIELAGWVTLVERVEVEPLEVTLVQFDLHPVAALLDDLLLGVSRGGRGAGDERAAELGPERPEARTAADLLLQRVPGLGTSQADGSAGSATRVRLRGISSFVSTDEPAVYLDGVRIDDGGDPGGGRARYLGVLDQIPASEVKRIRVLRGPAATSRYPVAAAGVILVETHSGSGAGA